MTKRFSTVPTPVFAASWISRNALAKVRCLLFAAVTAAACGAPGPAHPRPPHHPSRSAEARVAPAADSASAVLGPDPAPLLDADDVPRSLRRALPRRALPVGVLHHLGANRLRIRATHSRVELRFRGELLELVEYNPAYERPPVVRDAVTGESLRPVRDPRVRNLGLVLAQSSDGRWLAEGGMGDDCSRTTLWSATTEHQLTLYQRQSYPGASLGRLWGGDIYRRCVAFDARGERALIVSPDGTAHLVSLASGDVESAYEDLGCRPGAVALSPDGSRFACSTGRGGLLFRIATESAVELAADVPSFANLSRASAIAFSPDGALVAVATGTQVSVHDADSGEVRQRIRTWPGLRVKALAISPDGEWVATAAGARVDVWQRHTGRPIPREPGHAGPVGSIEITADGGRAFSAGPLGEVLSWDLADGSYEREVLPATGRPVSLVVAGDGRQFGAHARDRGGDVPLLLFDPEGVVTRHVPIVAGGGHVALNRLGNRLFVGRLGWLAAVRLTEGAGHHPRLIWGTPPRFVTAEEWADDDPGLEQRVISLGDGRLVVGAAMGTEHATLIGEDCDARCAGLRLGGRFPAARSSAPPAALGAFQDVLRVTPDPRLHLATHDAGLLDAVVLGDRVVTLSRAGQVYVWSPDDGRLIGCWRSGVQAITVLANDRLLGVLGSGGLVVFPAVIPQFRGRCESVGAAAVRPGHSEGGSDIAAAAGRVVSAGADGLLVWDAAALR